MVEFNSGGGEGVPAQDNSPSNPKIGDPWIDTSGDVPEFKVYSSSGWRPPGSPVLTTQEAVSFAETNVSLNKNKTEVVNGAFQLGDRWYETNINANLSTTFSNGGEYGMQFVPDVDTDSVSVRISPETTPDPDCTIRLRDGGANATILESATVSLAAGEWYTFNTSLVAGQTYSATIDGSYTMGRYDTPGSGEAGDITGGVSAGNNSSSYSFRFDAFRFQDGATDGGGHIMFDSIPTDLLAWDILTWQYYVGDGTVTAYVQTNDGSGWVNHESDVLPPYDIADIPETTDVRLRVVFSRPSRTATSPAVPYFARRGEM